MTKLGSLIGLGVGLAITERILRKRRKRKKTKRRDYFDRETRL